MNEKIKQLQKAAGIQVVRTLMREDENTEVKLMLTDAQLAKFAELIVRDCIGAVVSVPLPNEYEQRCADAVRKYFGVKV